jgi:hypothetical protein
MLIVKRVRVISGGVEALRPSNSTDPIRRSVYSVRLVAKHVRMINVAFSNDGKAENHVLQEMDRAESERDPYR